MSNPYHKRELFLKNIWKKIIEYQKATPREERHKDFLNFKQRIGNAYNKSVHLRTYKKIKATEDFLKSIITIFH